MDKKLWADLRGYLKEEHPCIICNSRNLKLWAKLNYLTAKKCDNRGMISVNPHFNDEGLRLLYSNYFKKRKENELLTIQRDDVYEIDHNWVTKFIDAGSVLDIGCSGGFFLSKFSADKWEREGVLTQEFYWNGKYQDRVMLSLIRDDFVKQIIFTL